MILRIAPFLLQPRPAPSRVLRPSFAVRHGARPPAPHCCRDVAAGAQAQRMSKPGTAGSRPSAHTILEIQSRLDFAPSSRGWAYLLEGERFINKDELDAAQKLINDCRKDGNLPLDICSEDDKRAAENLEGIDPDPQEMAASIFDYVRTAQNSYTPLSFWDGLPVYVQMAVEKSDLRSLFKRTCAEFSVPIASVGGQATSTAAPGSCGASWRRRPRASNAFSCIAAIIDPGGLQNLGLPALELRGHDMCCRVVA